MNYTDEKTVVIKLDASYKVKHEKYDVFQNSFFKEVYDQASQSVKEIIEAELEDYTDKAQNYTEPISNILAFIGKRGSGKTSAMLSFCDFLRDFKYLRQGDTDNRCNELLKMNDKVSFTVLDSMDATLIEKPKELIGAILGKMLVKIKEKEAKEAECGTPKDGEIRKLKKRLGDIYCSLTQDVNGKSDDTPSEVLEQLSRSWNQQQAFRKAVLQFNEYMVENKSKACRNYLVIPIDDVDMNLCDGYYLLEAIRKYLMSSNVIVLLAIDYQQLNLLCMNSYMNLLDNVKDIDMPQVESTEEHVRQLAAEYIEKMIPTGRRIYMPGLYQEKNLAGRRVLVKCRDKEIVYPIRELILYNMWEHSGIILSKNSVIHWLQPDSLRKLSNYVNAFRYLDNFGSGQSNIKEVLTKNINWFYEDLVNRYIKERYKVNNEKKNARQNLNLFLEAVPEEKIETLIAVFRDLDYADPRYSESLEVVNNSYGAAVGRLYRILVSGNFETTVHEISLALSLYMRKLVFELENGDEEHREDRRKNISLFSKDEFWGDYDIFYIQNKTLARYEYVKEMRLSEFLPLEDSSFEAEDLILLSMQLGLYKTKEGNYRGIFRFGNFVDAVFDYETRITKIVEMLVKGNVSKEKAEELEKAKESMIQEFRQWETKFGTRRIIPFDSVEFMFDVWDSLYGEDGAFAGIKAAKDYQEMHSGALKKIGDLLGEYDEYYQDIRKEYEQKIDILPDLKRKYKEVYENCPFIKYMFEDEREKRVIERYINTFENSSSEEEPKGEEPKGEEPKEEENKGRKKTKGEEETKEEIKTKEEKERKE